MKETITIQFDGGSRGNPGPAGVGVVLLSEDNTPLVTLGRYIGRATNNVAEYRALILGLEQAKKLGAQKLIVRGDSELVIKQVSGVYKITKPHLRDLYDEAHALMQDFDSVKLEHNLRHHNELADKLANLAMDRKGDVTEVDHSPIVEVEAVPTEAGDQFACARCGCVIDVIKPTSIRPHQQKPFVCQCGNKMNQKD